MSYTTTPIANRIGYLQGWSNLLSSKSQFNQSTEQLGHLKSYRLLSEYFKLNQLHLISYEACKNSNLKVLNLTFHKKVSYVAPKVGIRYHPHDYCKFSKMTLRDILKTTTLKLQTTRAPLFSPRPLFGSLRKYKRFQLSVWVSMNTLMEGVIRQAKTRRRSVTRHQRVWFQRKGVPLRGKAALLSKRRKKQRPGRLTPTLKENAPSLRRVFAMVEFELRKRRRWAVVNKGVKIHRGFKKPPIIRVLPRLQRPLAPFQEFHDLTETTYSSLQRVSKIQYSLDQYFQNWLGVHQVIKLQTPFDLFSRKRLYQGEQTLFSVRAFFRQKYFKQLLYALKVGQHHLNPQLVAVLITDELKRTRKQHRQIARNVSIMLADLRPSYIKGFKLRITGKFDGKDESTSEWFNSYKSPEVPTQQFNKRFGYSLESVCTYTGLFGVKLWIYY